jgi:hypothetical protein
VAAAASFSAMMIVGSLVLPLGIVGMIDICAHVLLLAP